MTPRAPVRLAEAARALDALATALERERVRSIVGVVRDLATSAAEPVGSDAEAEQRLVDLHDKVIALSSHKEGLDDVYFWRDDFGEQTRANRELDALRGAVKISTEPTGRPRLRRQR